MDYSNLFLISILRERTDYLSKSNKGMPAYYSIYKEMKDKITTSQWRIGGKLPSEPELCEFYNVSRTTVRKAVELLVQDNLVIKEQGHGTFIRAANKVSQKLESVYTISDEINKAGKSIDTKINSIKIVDSKDCKSEKVRDVFKDKVVLISRVRYIDEDPVMLESNYFSFKDFPDLIQMDLKDKQLYKTVENVYNIYIDEVFETFKAYRLDFEESTLLNAQTHMYGLLIDRVSYSERKIISYSQIISKGDMLEFNIRLKK